MSGPISVIVVDDEPLARERLRWLLQRCDGVELIAECDSGEAAIAAIVRDKPDVVFLDVRMGDMTGLEVVEHISAKEMPLTVFITAYDEYAVEAFEKRALDYLIKPFSDERFRTALERVRERIQQARPAEFRTELAGLLQNSPREPLERFAVRTGGAVIIVRSDAVDWIGSEGVYVRLHAGQASYLLRSALHDLEARLDPRRFVRIHRSAIVNIDRVQELRSLESGDYTVILKDGTSLKLSRTRKGNLERLLGTAF